MSSGGRLALALVGLSCGLAGCLERTVTVTSEPPGAVVRMNDVEIGRTPISTGFLWYGTYDVQVRKTGYEPLVTGAELNAPIYEYPPLDLAATVLPFTIHTRRHWHFELTPTQPVEGQAENELVARARTMRGELR